MSDNNKISLLSNVKLQYNSSNRSVILTKILLRYGKISYESIEIVADETDFKGNKMDTAILEINNNKLNQNIAINVYLRRKIGGLLGKTDEDEYQCIALLNTQNDIYPLLNKYLNSSCEEIKQNVILALNIKIKEFAITLENKYVSNGSGKYFLGDSLSIIDFYLVSNLFNKVNEIKNTFYENAPLLSKTINELSQEAPLIDILESEDFNKDLE